MLSFSLLYNFIKNFTILNIEYFYCCIIAFPAVCVCVQSPSMSTRYFYSLCNSAILVCVNFYILLEN
jgi:hypothetical protein